MNKLILETTRTTPAVILDNDAGAYSIQGISTPLDALEFYNGIARWITENETQLVAGSEFVFHMPYFNSASSKGLVFVLRAIKKACDAGRELRVVWMVEKDDEFMLEAAETYMEVLKMEFEIREALPVGRL